MSKYTEHVAKWKSCTRCKLCEGRTTVVLVRGSLPCGVLLVGEGPGESEDVLGKPFIGPAGKLLDQIVSNANEQYNFSTAFTNLVACIPRDEDGGKATEPEKESIKACEPRLAELVAMAKPKLVVCVGGLAATWVRKMRVTLGLGDTKLLDIYHPAYILRLNITQKGLAVQKTVVTLRTAFDDLYEEIHNAQTT